MIPEPEPGSRPGGTPAFQPDSEAPRPPAAARPRCAVFAKCGGCRLQDVDGDTQLREKQSLLVRCLADIGGIEPESCELLPPVTGPQWNYRRKARLSVRMVRRKGGVLVGFREKRGSRLTVMDACEVLAPPLGELIRPLRILLNGMAGREAIPQIEVAAGEAIDDPARARAALVLRHMAPLGGADLCRLTEFAIEWGLQMYLQPGGVDSAWRLYPRSGRQGLCYSLPDFGLRLVFQPLDFLQVNAAVNRRAIRLVTDLLDPGPEDHLLDLFCGIGNFTLPLATRCGAVTGVEGSGELLVRARENALANGLGNAGFIAADLYRKQRIDLPFALESCTGILLDPPRGGALEAIPLIAASGARRLVYLSCNPESLARDARELRRRGFDLKSAGVMDMFPHTSHIESVAMFESSQRRNRGLS